MERIIEIPNGIEAAVENKKVLIKGKKGQLERDFFSPLFREIEIKKTDNKIEVKSKSEKRKIKSMVGCIESHIRNMIAGVTDGFIRKLKIVYLHFPVTVKVSEREVLVQNFLGEKVPRRAAIVGDTKVEVKGDEIIVSGIDKEAVGETAARIERSTKIKRRDARVFQDGIFLVSK